MEQIYNKENTSSTTGTVFLLPLCYSVTQSLKLESHLERPHNPNLRTE